jgi:glucosamine-6-phosphate deaminase
MKVRVHQTALDAAADVAGVINGQLAKSPASVLGLPTGGSPLIVYRELVEVHRRSGISWRESTCFNLDEYVGLPRDDPRSYRHYMRTNLFDQIDCRPDFQHIPNGLAPDLDLEAERYEAAIIAAGGLDLVILGLGHNGHLAFNEPTTPFDSRTRVVTLAEQTIRANARYFDKEEDVPTKAITMGLGTIMAAKRIVLLATGSSKRQAVARMIGGPITPDHPASVLRNHAQVEIIVDTEAGFDLGQERASRAAGTEH